MNTIENNLAVTPRQELPQLIKQSSTYKLFVPRKVEEKFRYLCRKYPHTEWSGVLFYKHTGNFEDNNLEIHCEDFFPMDVGNATFTDFKMDESVVSYIAENIELFDCDMGLCHSHNTMSTFFSGTDIATLRSEGDDTNCFVSLIVNNAGTYCAAVTRKVSYKKTVEIRNTGSSYEFFGEGQVPTQRDFIPYEVKTSEESVIQYFMLDVQVEQVNNPLDYLDNRFEEIEAKKKRATPIIPAVNSSPSVSHSNEDFYSYLHSDRKTSAEAKEALLFDEETMDGMIDTTKWQPDPTIIHHLVCQLITCSLIINKDIDLKQWVVRHMDKMYDQIFSGSVTLEFTNWADFYVEFILNHYSDENIPDELLEDWDTYIAKIAGAVLDEIGEYPSNDYIEKYANVLSNYIFVES